jgi:peptide/nickel transport system permease protein
MSVAAASPDSRLPAPRSSAPEWLVVLSRAARTSRGLAGLVLAGVVIAVALIGPFVTPHSPTAIVTTPFAGPMGGTPLGGDNLGRDVLSRVLDGGRLLLGLAAVATLLGVSAGVAAGIAAAYRGRLADGLIMRAVDVLLAFPQLVFALLLVSVAGAKLWLIVLAVALTHTPSVARVIRAAALDVCDRDFVKAAELQGVPRWKVMQGEILPNVLSVVMVEAGLRFTYSILAIAALSFLGFGLQPPAADWGLMINENRLGLVLSPWAVAVPAALIAVLTIGLNTFTDAVARVSLGMERPDEASVTSDPTLEAVSR